MSSARLKLPDSFKDYYSFDEIIGLQERMLNTDISELDLSGISFFEPFSMVSLLLLGRNYLRDTGKRLFLVNIPLKIHQYLLRMDFEKKGIFQIEEKLPESYYLKRSAFSKSVIEITDIPNKERESVKAITNTISLFRRRANHILKYWMSGGVVDYFVTVISELCQNVFEHSLDSGYLAIQTYSFGTEHILRLVICDSGIGIRESFAQKKEVRYESHAELIEMALTTNLSSKREFGYGLSQVNMIMEKLKGSIYIRSEDASVSVVYKGKHGSSRFFLKNNLIPFRGTQISISLSG